MNFYKFANEVVDYATLKKKLVVFLDFSFHEKQITIKTNNIKKPHENDYWYQRNNEEDYKNEKYVVSGIKNTWFDSWDYIETRSFYGSDKKTIEYTLPGLSDDTQQILDEIKEYLKKNDLPVKTKYKAAYNGEMTETYFAEEHYCQKPFTSFVLYEILRVIEKSLVKKYVLHILEVLMKMADVKIRCGLVIHFIIIIMELRLKSVFSFRIFQILKLFMTCFWKN